MDNSGRGGTLRKLGSVPKVGEIKSTKQLGRRLRSGKKVGSFSYAKYVWLACPTCGKERWVQLARVRKPNFKGFCKDCLPGKGRPSREELLALYWDRGLSCRALARQFDVGRGEVKSWFKQYGIRLRSFTEAQENRRIRIEKVCIQCGREYKVSHCRDESKYCSAKCHSQAMEKQEVVKCSFCGKEFKVLPSARAKGFGKLCSARCRKYASRRRLLRTCLFCKKEFYAIPSKKGLYCSIACRKADPILRERRLRNSHLGASRHPNKAEARLLALLKKHRLPYEYVGDGRLVICGYNPDFANVNGKKKLIELFGDYWHSLKKIRYWHQTDLGRMMAYKPLGYDCLVVWEHELYSPEVLIAKIKTWDKKRIKAMEPEEIRRRLNLRKE